MRELQRATLPTAQLPRRARRRAALAGVALTALAAALPQAHAATEPSRAFDVERVQFADVIETTRPAVVQISVRKRAERMARIGGGAAPFGGNGPFGDNGSLRDFFRRFAPEGMPPRGGPVPRGGPAPEIGGVGSGFIVDGDGYVVTNHHVIEDATRIEVTLADGETLEAEIVGVDPHADLALLRVESDAELPSIGFGDSDRVRVGDWVVAIGSPFGLGGSVSAGIISARGRDIRSGPYDDYLQIDAPINSGNSGGPIIDANGQVVGVNTAIYSPNGGNVGIGFAIPARDARRIVAELREKGHVTRGWLGVQIQPVTEDMAEALGLDEDAGALVAAVVDDGPAERAGLRPGDVIVRFGDTAIGEPRDLSRAVAATRPGSDAGVTLYRGGERRTIDVRLALNEQAALAAAPAETPDANDALGLRLAPVTPGTAQRFGLEGVERGALVADVLPGTPAAAGGLRPGDVVLRVNERAIDDAEQAREALASAERGDRPVALLVRRGDGQFFTSLKPA